MKIGRIARDAVQRRLAHIQQCVSLRELRPVHHLELQR
jgi:hypothetical protein